MIQTLKDYWEEFSLLPKPVKNLIIVALAVGLTYAVVFTVKDIHANRQIEKLKKQNFELNRQANENLSRAATAEKRADAEKLRADNLETDIVLLDSKIKNQDENLQKTHTNSANHRRNLDTRRKQPRTNTSADDLQRRIENRLRQSKND